MSKRMQQGRPMIVMGDDAQRVKDKDAQEHNIQAARAVARSVRSTLGPKGMDKMLVDSSGSITITNDGVTILEEMDIDNPTAEMIIEVAESQEDEAGDGTTTAVSLAGELLKNAGELLERDIHPTPIITGYHLAAERASEEIDDIATSIDSTDVERLHKIAETSMTGKRDELDKEPLASLVVDAVSAVTIEGEDGETSVDRTNLLVETQTGRHPADSEVVDGAVVNKDPVHDNMPRSVEDANVLLLDARIEVTSATADPEISAGGREALQGFVDRDERELKEKVQKIADIGADVVFCQRGIDDLAQHYLAQEGILAIRRAKKGDLEILNDVLDATIVNHLEGAEEADLGYGDVTRDEDDELFYVEGEDAHGVTLVLRGSTDHVVDELERGVTDAVDVVARAVSDGRVLAGGGAPEVEVASRLRAYADSVSGREQLAIEAFADSLELVPRVLAENAGYDSIDTLVDLRGAHDDGEIHAGFNAWTGSIENTFEAGVLEPAHVKEQALTAATESANLVLKIDDIVSAGDLSTDKGNDEEPGAPGSGMGGGMGGMM
ncbi:thermosome subunit [Natrarchaeobius halalkaliphilus]|uniref:Thermosome subunit n=1 Tax=Natrarchaeobius halalkaliphilus TaxID=1679091 RepID=A0A3N6MSP9_9EURY|nr:thermosome subunit beta [Natrarchaeobius halalkaliphilus]RQG87775.1 thermosome subunit [Natrarchaeobius halalkaliphilus]